MVKRLRESVVMDILDAIQGAKNLIDDGIIGDRDKAAINVSSISRASKDLIMSFPVLCDNSIEPKTAGMITKAIERKCVTMMQLLFASCQFNAASGKEVIDKWHNNINGGDMSLDDYLDFCDNFELESANMRNYMSVADRSIKESRDAIIRENRNGCASYPVSSISEHSINDYTVSMRYGDIMVMEAKNKPKGGGGNTQSDDNGGSTSTPSTPPTSGTTTPPNPPTPPTTPTNPPTDNSAANSRYQYGRRQDQRRGRDGVSLRYSISGVNSASNQIKALDNELKYFTNQLLPSDVKKCNELVPSLMIVRFYSTDNQCLNQFVAGVKARLIAADPASIITAMESKNSDRFGFLNLIRATTKEISFVKDYLLAIDRAKIDAKRNSIRSNHDNRIWKILEKRATKSVWKRLTNQVNDAAAITTLVISQQLANVLRKDYNINLADTRVASAFMDAYNLLCICIVDESVEVARFFFDGDSWYEELSFVNLERETGGADYKKIVNLMSKVSRG